MNRLPHLAQRLFNTPLAITPDKAEIVMAALADRFGVAHLFRDGQPVALARPAALAEANQDALPPHAYDVVQGVAVIPVEGTLVNKLGTLRPYSGMTGYDGIRTNLAIALRDPEVEAIVLDIDSPGGECTGLFGLVDAIYAARDVKPIHAILSEMALSAGYALASACQSISVPRTGYTGSVGCIVMHVDWSRALAAGGVTVTLITHGDRKADANEYEPLSKSARDAIQARVDDAGELFVQTVARNRRMTVDAVRQTQAAIFGGADGVRIGFADMLAEPDQAFNALLATL